MILVKGISNMSSNWNKKKIYVFSVVYPLECEPYKYGPNCTFDCGHCKDNKPCSMDTGDCPSGCMEGWIGKHCITG